MQTHKIYYEYYTIKLKSSNTCLTYEVSRVHFREQIHKSVWCVAMTVMRNVESVMWHSITPIQALVGKFLASSNTTTQASLDWQGQTLRWLDGVKRSKFTIPDGQILASHAQAMNALHAKAITKPNKTPSKLADSSSSNNDNTPAGTSAPEVHACIDQNRVT
jgi:hypothetical protein